MKDAVILLLLKAVGCLPLWLARALGASAGWLLSCTNARAKRVTQTNIALCLGSLSQPKQQTLAAASLRDAGRVALEIPVIWRRSDAWVRRRVSAFYGRELIDNALAKQRGVIMLTPHLGNWEVLPAMMTLHEHLTILYQPPKGEALHQYLQQVRHRPRTTLAPTNRRGVVALTKALRAGKLAGILPDQVPDPGNGGIEAPFFGEPALTMTLVHSLMQRTGCEVLLTYALRTRGGFEVFVEPCDDAIYSPDAATAVAAMNRSISTAVASAPAQYQWEYKRFKGRVQKEPY